MIEIKEEFKNLIPALSAEEYAQLEANILNEGIREPIITWNGYIIDGHNRYDIATRFDLEYKTTSKHFESEIDVKIWMATNQLGRRNLSDYVKGELMEEIEKLEKQKGKKNISANKGGTTTLSTNDKEAHNTQKIVADKLGWSTGKKAQFDVVKKKAPEEVKEKLRNNELTIHAAYKEIKKEEKKEIQIQERKRLAEEGAKKEINIDFRLGDFEEVFADLPDGSIDCIITDPPYPYEFIEVWSKLSRFAKRVLKPNGYCIAYSGKLHLPEVMQRMSENLTYYWTFNLVHTGNSSLVRGRNIITGWKPILVFQNGFSKNKKIINDMVIGTGTEKSHHKWQQAEEELNYFIHNYTNIGDTILEPFAGGGTTITACIKGKRNVIAAEINEESYYISKKRISEL